MQYVIVLDTNRNSLAPCHPARAKELLRKGKAAVFRKQPFIIILNYVPKSPINTNFEIKIDPGSKTTGISIISKGKKGDRCIFGLNLQHRGPVINSNLESRRANRRARRARNTRYRKSRFLNRTKPEGWLAPSVEHRVLTIQTWIDRLMKWVPVTTGFVELVKFDTQKLKNPNISGLEYQQGRLYSTHMREYLLYRYNHTCQYCSGTSPSKILQWEHVCPKSRGGTDSLDNATLSCSYCNLNKGNKTLTEWLESIGKIKGKYFDALRKNIPRVIKGTKPPLTDAAVMNAIRYRIGDYFKSIGIPFRYSPGWITKRNRLDQGYRKDHWIDACCVGDTGNKVYVAKNHKCLTVVCQGHGSRQMQLMDKYGFPRTSAKGSSQINGFKTGDLVKATVLEGKYKGIHKGRISVRNSGYCDIKTVKGLITSHTRNIKAVQKTDGYSYSFGTTIKVICALETENCIKFLKGKLKTSGIKTYQFLKQTDSEVTIQYSI